MCLEHEAQKGCDSGRGLLKAVRKGSFVRATYALSDVLPILSKLSLILQRQALNNADVGPVVEATVNTISSLKSNPGHKWHLSHRSYVRLHSAAISSVLLGVVTGTGGEYQ